MSGGLLTLEGEGTKFLWHAGNHSHSDKASYLRWSGPSEVSLWEPEVSCFIVGYLKKEPARSTGG